jgi:hypothetical protein
VAGIKSFSGSAPVCKKDHSCVSLRSFCSHDIRVLYNSEQGKTYREIALG